MQRKYYGWVLVAIPLGDGNTWDWKAYAPGRVKDILTSSGCIWNRQGEFFSPHEALADGVWHVERYLALDAIYKALASLCNEGKLTSEELSNCCQAAYHTLNVMQPLPKF